ncbi:MAG TPA: DUF1697 domain-containing protein [Candidatus Nanopelagicales bacterium]|nr:DUF1697 domain-containing protein [Candidatus Nanopelagicales bacterium]
MRWAALVRNVMVGREGLTRAVLLDALQRSGGARPESLLTTGNLRFDAASREAPLVVGRLEERLESILGRRELVAARSQDSLLELLALDPFAGFSADEWECEVAFLRHDAPAIRPASLGDSGRTVLLAVRTREVVAARPRTGGRRPHVNRLLEHATGRPATARGWSTLQRLAAPDRGVPPDGRGVRE